MAPHTASVPWANTPRPRTSQSPAVTRPKFADTEPGGENWQDRAECAKPWYPLDLFFPITYVGPVAEDQITQARAAYFRCPSQGACLDWALRTRERAGVWGAATPDEREAMVRRAARQQARRDAA